MWGARQAAIAEASCETRTSAGGAASEPLAGKRQNEHVNEAELASMNPGLESKGPSHGNSAPQSGMEGGAAKGDAEVKVVPKVPH